MSASNNTRPAMRSGNPKRVQREITWVHGHPVIMYDPAYQPKGATSPPTQARGGQYFPDVEVISHEGKSYRLYTDLINQDRVVMVNFMSINNHDRYPVCDHLNAIVERMGDRMGKDVFLYSITTNPVDDTPARLRELSSRYGNKQGWYFLASARNAVKEVSDRLHRHKGHSKHHNNDFDFGHPTRMVHYGNGQVGLWGAFGADSTPEFVAERLSWLQDARQRPEKARRAGPRRMAEDSAAYGHNRVV